MNASLQVQGELGVGYQVRQPIPPEARPACDEVFSVEEVEEDFDPMRIAATAPDRCHVGNAATAKRAFNLGIHTQ